MLWFTSSRALRPLPRPSLPIPLATRRYNGATPCRTTSKHSSSSSPLLRRTGGNLPRARCPGYARAGLRGLLPALECPGRLRPGPTVRRREPQRRLGIGRRGLDTRTPSAPSQRPRRRLTSRSSCGQYATIPSRSTGVTSSWRLALPPLETGLPAPEHTVGGAISTSSSWAFMHVNDERSITRRRASGASDRPRNAATASTVAPR
jgi:hypothetical protein